MYLVQAGCSSRKLPAGLFGVSRTTAQFLHRLNVIGEIDWSRAVVDSITVRAGEEGNEAGPNPVDRGKPGSKIHVLCDRTGLPLTVLISAANVHDSQLMFPPLDSVAPVRSVRGRPRTRPAKLHADRAYDIPALRTEIRRRGITVRIARNAVESSQRLGRQRWIVEACLSRLLDNRRLVRRYERKADHFQAFADLGCLLLCYRRWTKATN